MTNVGVFDSGVGGLSVLAQFRELRPEHPFIYLADQSWAPYGERSLTAVRARSVAISRYLIDRGCGLIVVACNSASAAALHHLRVVFPAVQFVGMEPAVKPAASRSERGVIGVLATDATFQGELYSSVLDRHANGTQVVEQACPGLADAVERLGIDHPDTLRLVRRYVTPLRNAGIDTLVLGCTHYTFLMDTIVETAGPEVHVIDPAPAVARQTARLLGDSVTSGASEFLTTGDTGVFAGQISAMLGIAASVGRAKLEDVETLVTVVEADITQLDVGAIVNAANPNLNHGGGVAAAIVAAGGAEIQSESHRWVEMNGPLSPGVAAVTTGGRLPAETVIHVAGPIFSSGQDNEGLLRLAVSAALDAAVTAGVRSVAIPAISAGVFGYPVAEATATIADEVVGWIDVNPASLDVVQLVAFDRSTSELFSTGLTGALG